MRELVARLFCRRRAAARSADDVALRMRVYAAAIQYARVRSLRVPRELVEISPTLQIVVTRPSDEARP